MLKRVIKQILFSSIGFILNIFPKYFQAALLPIIVKNINLKNVRGELPFKFKDQSININFGLFDTDTSIFPFIVKNSGWETYEAIEIKNHLGSNQNYTLIDFGANQGLFTIQLLKLIERDKEYQKTIGHSFLFEADPRLKNLITKNVSSNFTNENNIQIIDKAISLTGGNVELFQETENTANNSLDQTAMINATSDQRRISVESMTSAEVEIMLKEKRVSKDLIYKSDIQGLDIPILLSFSSEFINDIKVLLIEFWPYVIKSKDIDINPFINILRRFRFIKILNSQGILMGENPSELIDLLDKKDSTTYFNIIASK